MPEGRFYIKHNYECPICRTVLAWIKRVDIEDSMVLWHVMWDCPNAGKAFYPPALSLAEAEGRIVDEKFVPAWADPALKRATKDKP